MTYKFSIYFKETVNKKCKLNVSIKVISQGIMDMHETMANDNASMTFTFTLVYYNI